MKAYLGLDTSCYTTSAALVDERGGIIADARAPLAVKPGERGMRQSDMVFKHTGALPALIQSVFADMRAAADGAIRVAGVAASVRPRDVEGSYMPAFTVGEGYGRALAAALGAPFHATSHQRGHIYAGLEGAPTEGVLHAVHASGGTTELLLVDGGAVTLLGGTLDIAAGQLVDRTGVMLGLPFPAGPRLEALAQDAGDAEGLIRPVIRGVDISLSGAEAQLKRWYEMGAMGAADVAVQTYHAIAAALAAMLRAARVEGSVLFVGGVASSAMLRRLLAAYLPECITPRFAAPALSGDNAVGVAYIARENDSG